MAEVVSSPVLLLDGDGEGGELIDVTGRAPWKGGQLPAFLSQWFHTTPSSGGKAKRNDQECIGCGRKFLSAAVPVGEKNMMQCAKLQKLVPDARAKLQESKATRACKGTALHQFCTSFAPAACQASEQLVHPV